MARQVWKPFEWAEIPRIACIATGRPSMVACRRPKVSVQGWSSSIAWSNATSASSRGDAADGRGRDAAACRPPHRGRMRHPGSVPPAAGTPGGRARPSGRRCSPTTCGASPPWRHRSRSRWCGPRRAGGPRHRGRTARASAAPGASITSQAALRVARPGNPDRCGRRAAVRAPAPARTARRCRDGYRRTRRRSPNSRSAPG